jgi:hypothetical protein
MPHAWRIRIVAEGETVTFGPAASVPDVWVVIMVIAVLLAIALSVYWLGPMRLARFEHQAGAVEYADIE